MGNEKITLLLAVLFCHSLIGHAQELPVTQEQGYQGQPAIWGDWVVWRDVQPDSNNSSNIYAKNLTAQNTIQLSYSNSAGPPTIYENTVVWADRRNGSWDLFSYDLIGENESPLYVADGNQIDPVIYGDKVAFISGEDSNQAIFLYSISREIAWCISDVNGYKWKPDISENLVVWGDYRNNNWDIYGCYIDDYDINVPNDFPIATGQDYQRSVAVWSDTVWGDTIVYEETMSPSGTSNIGVYNQIWEKTRYVHLLGVIDWLDIHGEFLVWGEYGESAGTNIYGYYLNLENPEDPCEFTVCTKSAWQYAPVIYESKVVFSSDDVEEGYQHFYNRDVYCMDINDVNMSEGRVDVYEDKIAYEIMLDDMEYYDLTLGELIWYYWDNPDWTGSYIDLGTKPWQPVHDGNQSMKYEYYNKYPATSGGYYSETVLTFDGPQDWESTGVKLLTLYFYGDPGNDANNSELMYVGIEDSATFAKVSYDGDMNDIKVSNWQKWVIPLSEFTSVSMSAVEKIYIGFGDSDAVSPGGFGVVYFDDITVTEGRGDGDLNDDGSVDFKDLKLMVEHWLKNNEQVDFNADSFINLKDFAELARSWSP
ncbi:MAG: dockerin type I domain-containing protein [Planctomycetota bacterium]|jgi:beta propeller repeat protein